MAKRPRNGHVTRSRHAATVNLGALSGFTIAVTADRRREEQAELIERRGGTVLHGPVIRTLPLADEAGLRRATAELIDDHPDVVVLSTALGVRGWFSAAESLGLDDALLDALAHAEILVRGPKAGGAAITAGLVVTWQTPEATYRELLAHLATRPTTQPSGRPVRLAVQLDGDGSAGLADTLGDLGYDVVAVPVYEWSLPEDLTPAERLIGAVADHAVDAVTFTSAHAVANFAVLAEKLGILEDVIASMNDARLVVACVGPVTAARARTIGVRDPIEPRHARLGAMVQALATAFTDRVVTIDLEGTSALLQGRLVAVGGDEPIALTDRERAVLEALARRPGAVVSKQALLEQIWEGESDDHVVEVTVGRLRRRLGPAGEAIETVVRRGYRLAVS